MKCQGRDFLNFLMQSYPYDKTREKKGLWDTKKTAHSERLIRNTGDYFR